MIEVSLCIVQDGSVWVDLTGHAGYAEKGKDIVCAAVSALFFSTVNSITDYTAAEIETFDKRFIDGRGGSMSHIKNLNEQSELLLKSMLSGMLDLQKQYPNNVKTGEGVEDFIKT